MGMTEKRVRVAPDGAGLAQARHGLDTEDVTVACWTADGRPRRHLFAVPVSADEVEVRVTDDTRVVVVTDQRPETHPEGGDTR